MESKFTVSIILFRMFHYRIDFLNLLREKLSENDIALNVYYGKPSDESLRRKDSERLLWGKEITSKVITISGKEVMLQLPPLSTVKSDLVIAMHENRLLINYFFQLFRPLLKMKFAFWGHGQNFQSNNLDGMRERLKRKLVHQSDWYFAYTDLSRNALISADYPENKITVFNNTIDSKKFRSALQEVTPSKKNEFLAQLGISQNACVGLFCGSIYPLKRPEELIECVLRIRQSIDNFHLIVIGAGSDAPLFEKASQEYEWIHFLGMQKGEQKSKAYSACHVILNPGLVGLNVVDAFSAGKVFVTMEANFHSPEVSYIKNGENGIMTTHSIDDYSQEVISLLQDEKRREMIETRSRETADEISLENMVDRFVDGVKSALNY